MVIRLRFAVLLLSLTLLPLAAQAQSSYLSLDPTYTHWVDRYEVLSGEIAPEFHTSQKPYRRSDVVEFIERMEADSANWSKTDRENFAYLKADSWEFAKDSTAGDSKKPTLKHFYKKRGDIYHVQTGGLDLHVQPVVGLSVGKESEISEPTYMNTRGVQLRGMIDKKVGFQTFLADNQMRFPSYVRARVGETSAIPGEGFWKPFGTGGYDFLTARGHITFDLTDHIGFQFGHDQNQIGNGERSLILSGYSPAYTFLKFQTKVWKLQYTNIFAELTADILTDPTGVPFGVDKYPNKHMAFHHLSLNVGKNLNIGVFEAIMYTRGDSAGDSRWDVGYLNPVIFYRSIEQNLGSDDNALLGVDFKWNFLRHFQMYGQVVLDEFVISEVRAGNGWWANKQSAQLGVKYLNAFGLRNLDLQGEFNVIRPYMYTHTPARTSYTHYNQPLAHPNGANMYEMVGVARYQPTQKLMLTGKLIYTRFGADTASSNFGSDLLQPNDQNRTEYGNTIAQGLTINQIFLDLTVSYMLRHNLFLDLQATYRRQEAAELEELSSDLLFGQMAVRWNLPQRRADF